MVTAKVRAAPPIAMLRLIVCQLPVLSVTSPARLIALPLMILSDPPVVNEIELTVRLVTPLVALLLEALLKTRALVPLSVGMPVPVQLPATFQLAPSAPIHVACANNRENPQSVRNARPVNHAVDFMLGIG